MKTFEIPTIEITSLEAESVMDGVVGGIPGVDTSEIIPE